MRKKASLESFMGIIENSHEKIAGEKKVGGELLAKLAAELDTGAVGNPVEAASAAGAPAASAAAAAEAATKEVAPAIEGDRAPAESVVEAANPEVVAMTAAVADPQVAIAGGNLAESAAGEMSPPIKPNQGVRVSANDGEATTANEISREPEAVVAAAEGGGGAAAAAGEMPDAKEAEKIGTLIATSFHGELQKVAANQEFTDAVAYLQSNEILTNYNFSDESGIQKTAAVEETDGLEKIAGNKNLTRQDIINAAHELEYIEKNAGDAEEFGRQQARDFVAAAKNIGGQTAETADPNLAKFAENKEVMSAVAVLKQNGLL